MVVYYAFLRAKIARIPMKCKKLRHFLQIRVESYAKEALLKQDILVKLFTCHVLKHQIRKPDYLMIGLHSFVIMNYVFSYIFVRLQIFSQKNGLLRNINAIFVAYKRMIYPSKTQINYEKSFFCGSVGPGGVAS